MKLLFSWLIVISSCLLAMERPLVNATKDQGKLLPLLKQIIMADGKCISAHYDEAKQIIAFDEYANQAKASKPNVFDVNMDKLVITNDLRGIKILGLARLTAPQEFIAILLANKGALQDTLLCMRVNLSPEQQKIKAARFHSLSSSTFTDCVLRLDQTGTNLTILAQASTAQENILEEHTIPVYLAPNDDFLLAFETTKETLVLQKKPRPFLSTFQLKDLFL